MPIDPDKLPPNNKRTIVLGQDKVTLDPDRLLFNEATLSEFQDRLATWYDYFGEMFILAEYLTSCKEVQHEVAYAKVYAKFKEEGCTDKLSDAHAKSDPDVEEAKKQAIRAKYRQRELDKHIKAWDKAHDNAQSRGHMVRKEMDKLHSEIYFKNRDLATKVDEIMGK